MFRPERPRQYLAFATPLVVNGGTVVHGLDDTIARLGAAVLVGGAIGLNRDLHGKPAGLRTHALVCLGAALATLVGLKSSDQMALDPNAVSRIVQGILTGIGFLGAGVILHNPPGQVSGLTTAATVWICAVLGVASGLGYWTVLAIAAALVVLALSVGGWLERLCERVLKRGAHFKDGAP